MAAAPTAKNAIARENMYALEDAFGPFMPTSHRMNHAAPTKMNHAAGAFRAFFISGERLHPRSPTNDHLPG